MTAVEDKDTHKVKSIKQNITAIIQ